MNMIARAAAMLAAGLTLATGALAQDDELGEAVLIELNAVKSNEASCTLTFLALNGHSAPINKVVYETVLFDASGQVDRLALFDFGTLPPGRPRVRQFTLQGLTCEGVGKVLINGAHTCDAPDLDATACEAGLIVDTRTNIEVIG